MLENQPGKTISGQGPGFQFLRFTIKVLEGDPSVLMGEDIPLGDHAPVQITGQVLQGKVSLSREPTIHNPVFLVKRGGIIDSELVKTGQELSPEQAVPYLLGDQESVSGMDTKSLLRLVSDIGNNEMDMGMKVQPAAVGVQDTGKQVIRLSSIGIKRYIKIKAKANPYAPQYAGYIWRRKNKKDSRLLSVLTAREYRASLAT